MAKAAPAYVPMWLRPEATFKLFHEVGIDQNGAGRWLKAAYFDRGETIRGRKDADPSRHFFRLPLDGEFRIMKVAWPNLIAMVSIRMDGVDSTQPRLGDLNERYWRPVPIEVSRQLLMTVLPKAKAMAGRKPTIDWDGYKEALRIQINEYGMPDPANEPGWRYQSDVEKFIAKLLLRHNDDAGERTIRRWTKKMLSEIKGHN
jgi:hypothetical protein